ncbi:hypothetical protein [Lysinibacillus sp. BW-2-10]|uniref:hypothetical protein n=1 Tax=Lysinibacillus sp. BW-2-10 TaxID=2590030 RepID=UPI00117DC748|nr:hypothetical protein [Lysinibacillus sp. BW-2-10]TSI07870.1 hypothetical protein FJQ64_07795 [Lysinibacillus sp. BW-2-10]
MEAIVGVLLGTLGLFYPLLLGAILAFVYALLKRSWVWMLISALLLYPDAWYFSGYPPFPWVKWVPFMQVILALMFYLNRNKTLKSNL